MKKVMLLIMAVAIIACGETDQGRKNACQYVREQMPEQLVNIKSVEVVKVDSVISPFTISLGTSEIHSMRSDYYGGGIAIEEWRAYSDSMLSIGLDAERSWIMLKEWNDSLKMLSKYTELWRKAYLVEVTMKSGAIKQYRVCMNEDGITPFMTFEQFKPKLDEFLKALND